MPIYLDYTELDREILGTIEFKVMEPTVQVFGGSTIRSLNEAMSLKPEAVCQECGNAAATHRWNGATFLCPGPVSRGMQLAEQYLNENIDDYVRTLPAVQTLITAMAQCLDRDDRRAADVLSRRILKLQYDYERSRNTIDKRISLDSYESYMQQRAQRFIITSNPPPPDLLAIDAALTREAAPGISRKNKPARAIGAPPLDRPKRNYGDDY